MRFFSRFLFLFIIVISSCGENEEIEQLSGKASSQANTITKDLDFIVLDFDNILKGEIVSVIETGGCHGYIGVHGINPKFPNQNTAMVFDSSNPTEGDFDLGTPNEMFNGPGKSINGNQPSNNTSLGNMLIVSEDLNQNNPNDSDRPNTAFVFDFTKYGEGTVTLHSLEILDLDGSKNSTINLLNPENQILQTLSIKPGNDNSKQIINLLSTSNVAKMEILLGDSAAIDNITLSCKNPAEQCSECIEGLKDLTLKYNGQTNNLSVRVLQRLENRYVTLFNGTVSTGDEILLESRDGESPLGKELRIYVQDQFFKSIVADCSKPIGNGFVFGEFQIVSGTLLNGSLLCDGNNEEEQEEPERCCENGVASLTLEYIGETAAQISVFQETGNNQATSQEIFNGFVFPKQRFNIFGNSEGAGLTSAISIRINNYENAFIDTSCAQEIGPGFVEGEFKVISGTDVNGNVLCPIRDCCNTVVTQLSLFYQESFLPAEIVVLQFDPSGNARYIEVFRGQVEPFGFFTFNGKDKQGGFGKEILIFTNGILNSVLSTSCLTPVNVGITFGSFEIVDKVEVFGEVICRSR